MKPVLVTWLDAVSEDAWTDLNEAMALEPATQVTLGYLIHEDSRVLVIAASYDKQNNAVASFYAIPKSWIVSVIPMKTEDADG